MDTSDTVLVAESVDKNALKGYNVNRGDTYGYESGLEGPREDSSISQMGWDNSRSQTKGFGQTFETIQKRANRSRSVERRQIGDKSFDVITEKAYTPAMKRMADEYRIDGYKICFATSSAFLGEIDGTIIIPYEEFYLSEYIYTQGVASFTEQRLNYLLEEYGIEGDKHTDYSKAYIAYISPDEFLNLTSNKSILEKVQAESTKLDVEELRREQETPFLEYNPKTGEVVNHEGRHRMVALKADGIEKVAVVLKPNNDSFERRTPQDISLTGQSFKNGQAVGIVTVSNAIPLSEKYRNEAVAGFAENSDADIRYSMPRKRYADYDKPITIEDIEALRSIGRKSVNDFTDEDIEKSQKWAYKFYQQLGEKSPFFRAWFGDWRAYDISAANVVSFAYGENPKLNYSKRFITCKELNTKILVDETIINDSLSYAKKNGDEKQIRKLLGKVDEILSNGVLLDTQISTHSSGNKKGSTQFMHYLYTPISINGAPFIAKLSIEEYDLTGKNRAYNLQRIELSEVSRAQYSQLIAENRGKYAYTSDALSVAQLFDFVKQKDKNFNPNPVNQHLLNADGTPKKFYHGTNAEFTEFNPDEFALREGSFFFAENSDADIRYSMPRNKKITNDGEIHPIYLNVGRARNDATYHLYDITQKLRDTAHRVNDVGRPVGNALKNDISNAIISNSSENVKHSIPRNADTLTHTEIFDLVDKGEMTTDEGFEVLRQRYGALNDEKYIIPVQFEIKQFVDDNNRLYFAVALTKIETGVMGNTIPNNSRVSTNLVPISNISIPELFSKINPKDKKFLKYVPDEFLNSKQKEAKNEALREEINIRSIGFLMPDGSQFVLDEKRDTAETAGGVNNNSGLSPTDNVSTNIISNSSENVKHSIPRNAEALTYTEIFDLVDKGEMTTDEGFQVLRERYGALNDEKYIIPVQFEIKQFVDDNNRLYFAVALTKIETGVKGNTASEKQMSTSLIPVSNISIPQMFSKINPKDKKFLKYVPDEFLNSKQKEAKNEALREDDIKYGKTDTKHSIPRNAEALTYTEIFDLVDKGEMTTDEGFEVLRQRYGTIKQGEKAKEEVLFPKKISDSKTVSRYTRTAAESGHLDEGLFYWYYLIAFLYLCNIYAYYILINGFCCDIIAFVQKMEESKNASIIKFINSPVCGFNVIPFGKTC